MQDGPRNKSDEKGTSQPVEVIEELEPLLMTKRDAERNLVTTRHKTEGVEPTPAFTEAKKNQPRKVGTTTTSKKSTRKRWKF